MENALDRREFTRIAVNLEAKVIPEAYPPFSAQVINASLKGVYLRSDSPLPVGTPCGLELFLGNKHAPIRITAKARVARVDGTDMGLEITSLMGTESFEHLWNLVLYNAASADTDKILQEFQAHVGLKRWEQEHS